ncbi:MAG: TetR/AcrR family transcriptional regulator [Myxococcales bacterium]
MGDSSPPRRTQEMRSAETRAKILDATVDSLIEQGYAATSTPEVCRRAGVSRGALLHHFPTKAELVIDAVTHLARKRAEDMAPRARVTDADDPLDAAFESVWSAFFSGPLFHAALELWVAARSDPELHAALYPAEQSMGRIIRQAYAGVGEGIAGSSPAERARFDDLVSLTIHLVRGMAVQQLLKDDDRERRRLFEVWKSMARRYLSAG